MIRKSHLLLALALVAAAVAAPIAQASSAPKVDPLAVGYLIGQGYTPSQVQAWTVGACSHEAKPAACFGPSKGASLGGRRTAVPDVFERYVAAHPYGVEITSGGAKVDPLAVGYLIGRGLSPSEVKSWTVGACSHEVKAASCYAMLEPAAASTPVARSTGFQWGDAGIGAGFTLGIVLLLGGAGAGLLISRQNRHQQAARA